MSSLCLDTCHGTRHKPSTGVLPHLDRHGNRRQCQRQLGDGVDDDQPHADHRRGCARRRHLRYTGARVHGTLRLRAAGAHGESPTGFGCQAAAWEDCLRAGNDLCAEALVSSNHTVSTALEHAESEARHAVQRPECQCCSHCLTCMSKVMFSLTSEPNMRPLQPSKQTPHPQRAQDCQAHSRHKEVTLHA